MSKRTISITPQYFNMSTKKNKKVKTISQVNINTSSIRQLLLDKLKEHKKTRKIETKITPLQEKTFDESCKEVKDEVNKTENTNNSNHSNEVKPMQDANQMQHANQIQSTTQPIIQSTMHPAMQSVIQPTLNISDKPYGNLKNGTKPTYKQMLEPIKQYKPEQIELVEPITPSILEEKEVKKTFKLGKNDKTKTISVLIKNNKTRKKVEDIKTEHKKKNMSTIKNYLKEKNLIKFGSIAPSRLLREMFETSELCGGISNENKDVLIHNFNKILL